MHPGAVCCFVSPSPSPFPSSCASLPRACLRPPHLDPHLSTGAATLQACLSSRGWTAHRGTSSRCSRRRRQSSAVTQPAQRRQTTSSEQGEAGARGERGEGGKGERGKERVVGGYKTRRDEERRGGWGASYAWAASVCHCGGRVKRVLLLDCLYPNITTGSHKGIEAIRAEGWWNGKRKAEGGTDERNRRRGDGCA